MLAGGREIRMAGGEHLTGLEAKRRRPWREVLVAARLPACRPMYAQELHGLTAKDGSPPDQAATAWMRLEVP